MTAKDFIWLAQWLSQYPNLIHDYDALDDLMWYCQARNPRFDRTKFLTAVGFDQDEITDIWGDD